MNDETPLAGGAPPNHDDGTLTQIGPTLIARVVWIREALELDNRGEALQAISDLEEDLAS